MQDIGLIVCADSGDFGIRFFVDTAGFPQVDVCTQVADHEDDVFCGDIFNVGSNGIERSCRSRDDQEETGSHAA